MKDRLKLIRKSLNLTQQEFAESLGIKRNTIATYEIGRNEPIDAVVQLICNKYNINEEWLRTGKGEMRDTVPTDDFMEIATKIDVKDKKARQAIVDYWNLSDDDKELFWKFIERFAKK